MTGSNSSNNLKISQFPDKKYLPFFIQGLAVAATGWIAVSSVIDLQPGKVAVRINDITGSQEAITQPGWLIRVPLVHSVFSLDAAPQTFSMEGTSNISDLHVKELTVRASDGSNFHFDDTTLIFQLKGEEATNALRDSGLEAGYQVWMKPYVRSILRDEFGRESTIDVSNPTTYAQATNRAKTRLNEELGPHGLTVTQLVTPRPRFNGSYEEAIEQRNALGNEEQVIKSNLDRSNTERASRLAKIDQEKNKLIQEKQAQLESNLARARAAQEEAKRESDTYKINTIAEGQAEMSAAKQRAAELKLELKAKLSSKKAEIQAFRNQPVERVMERLGEKLEGVTIEIQPWADDSSPTRVRYEDYRNGE
jgi:regulator of protease activity HflC (stomatin/prohibitin superfamily)